MFSVLTGQCHGHRKVASTSHQYQCWGLAGSHWPHHHGGQCWVPAGARSDADLPSVTPGLASKPLPLPAMSGSRCCEPRTRSKSSHSGQCPRESRPGWAATTQSADLRLVGWPADTLPQPQLGCHTLALPHGPGYSAPLSLFSWGEKWEYASW